MTARQIVEILDSDGLTDVYSILADEYRILKSNEKAEGFMIYSYNSLISDDSREEMQNLRNLLH